MTIAAGFLYNGGVLICADTQYTGQIKAHGSKLLRFEYEDGSRSIFATVGSGRYARMGVQLIQDFIAALSPGERTLLKMQAVLRSGIRELHHEHLFKHPSYKTEDLSVQYLAAFWSAQDKKLGFYGSEETAVSQLYGYECFGSGETLGHYLIRRRYRRVTDINQRPKHSEAEVRRMATEALSEVKKYVPYCGGDSQCVTLTFDGKLSRVHPVNRPLSRGSRLK